MIDYLPTLLGKVISWNTMRCGEGAIREKNLEK